ncbi:hypothetical protein [Sphingobacterium puteale]|uniref:hypothetical protein n=1 Tax=Sphingobacterium puteale TaxID=2420510 RepID=UPI003D95F459
MGIINKVLNNFSQLLFLGMLLLCSSIQASASSKLKVDRLRQFEMLSSKQYVKMLDGKLYIGAKFDTSNDIIIVFEKCMFNELMTFSKVGLADNLTLFPLAYPERKVDRVLNETSSDNIGPVMLKDGGWVGGNHSFMEKGTINTAKTISFAFYADGKLLRDGDAMEAEIVTVKVKNEIYDPFQPTKGADGIELALKEILLEEDITYTIQKGQLYVEVSHSYKNTKEYVIERYYGMQSMFAGETEVMTPNGSYFDFQPEPEELFLYKNKYPSFNRFIERNSVAGICQSSYLMPFSERDPYWSLTAGDKIFVRAHGKTYHNQIADRPVRKGAVFSWSGLYNWFTPLVNDRRNLVYMGIIKGEIFLFIDCKQQGQSKLKLPEELDGKKYRVVEKGQGISYLQDGRQADLNADHAGSIILAYY